MNIAYFDCIAGASGDMILGAMIDAGLSEDALRERLDALHLPEFELAVERVVKHGFSATKVEVRVADDVPERHVPEITAIIRESALDPALQAQAIDIFERLGRAEASIHGTTPDHVHLHELGGVDTIVDVVGALVGLDALGVERVYASPLPMARGFVHGAHGAIPLPAPATVAVLAARGDVPIVGSDLATELVTPTGAVLLASLAAAFGPLPAMTLTGVGYGAGGRDLAIPNVLRLFLGRQAEAGTVGTTESLVMLETNIDDLNPEFYAHVMARLFSAGALDVFMSPIQMKKNRPATLLHALCRPGDAEALKAVLFEETSTLGVRQHIVARHALARSVQEVETPFGPVRVKIARLGGGHVKAAPEYEDCRRLAEAHDVPLREVYHAAEHAAADAGQHRHSHEHH